MRDADWLARNPKARADDLMAAFVDETIDGIISTIGGEDSIRTLPYLDLDLIRDNPKVFMGYSDTTISHAACFKAGLVSFYGPSFMARVCRKRRDVSVYGGFRQTHALFCRTDRCLLNRIEWNGQLNICRGRTLENQSIRRKLNPCTGLEISSG